VLPPAAAEPAPPPRPAERKPEPRPEPKPEPRPEPKPEKQPEAAAARDPFSIEDIEAEFARLLGRPLEKK
jgi:hypothetical protein